MTGSAERLVLATVIVVGIAAVLGPGATGALFTDAHDGTGQITAVDSFGSAGPTADAGGSYTVDEGNSVTLDGSGSTTSQGNIQRYAWQITSGPGSLVDSGSVQPTYQAPSNVASDTAVTVELTVEDNNGNTDTDTATVTVRDVGTADVPSVDTLTVTTQGRRVQVSADVSDPTGDGDSLSSVAITVVRTQNGNTEYTNTVSVSGDSDSVSDTTGRLAPNKQYEVRVTVTDGSGDSSTATQSVST